MKKLFIAAALFYRLQDPGVCEMSTSKTSVCGSIMYFSEKGRIRISINLVQC